jgi:hypothetical protein
VVGDRAVEALLGGRQPRLQPGREVLDVAVQRAEVAVERGGVADEVARVAFERRRASTMTESSAIRATAPAASATMPVVVVSSSTAERIGGRAAAQRVKMTV